MSAIDYRLTHDFVIIEHDSVHASTHGLGLYVGEGLQ